MFMLLYTRDGLTIRHQLAPGDTILGRAPICDLAIDDPSISRRHVRFRVHGDHCVLTDLGGRNGTFLNGEEVLEAEVEAGDVIVLGRFPLRVERAGADWFALDDTHMLVEARDSVYRRLDEENETRPGVGQPVHPERLLLLLSEIAQHLAPPQPLPDLLTRIVTVVFNTISVDRVFLLLIDDGTGRVVPALVRARDGQPMTRVSLNRTVIERVIQERLAILAGDAMLESPVRSFIAAPLAARDRVVGVLYVDNPQTSRLSPSDLDVLLSLASFAARAIEEGQIAERRHDEARWREALRRSHPPAVVDRLSPDSQGSSPLELREREVTVLASRPIWGADSSAIAATALTAVITRALRAIEDAVFAEGGSLVRLAPDGILAAFGAVFPHPDHAAAAARAALAARRQIAVLAGEARASIHTAVHSGRAVAGMATTAGRREFVLFGDAVETCSRILWATAARDDAIVVSALTAKSLSGSRVNPIGAVAPAGTREAIELYELLDS